MYLFMNSKLTVLCYAKLYEFYKLSCKFITQDKYPISKNHIYLLFIIRTHDPLQSFYQCF